MNTVFTEWLRTWRYELRGREGGVYIAHRRLVDAPEPLGCELRLELLASTPKGLLLVPMQALMHAIERDSGYQANDNDTSNGQGG